MDYFTREKEILEEAFNLEVLVSLYFQEVQDSITEDNFGELYHLVRFIEKNHNETLLYYENERDALKARAEGINQENYSENNLEAFREFYRKIMTKYSPAKGVEKTK